MPCQAQTSITPALDAFGQYHWTWSIRQEQGEPITLLSVTVLASETDLPLSPQPTWFSFVAELVPPGGTPTGGSDPGSLPTSAVWSYLHLHVSVASLAMVTGAYCVQVNHRVGTGPIQQCLFPMNIGTKVVLLAYSNGGGGDLFATSTVDFKGSAVKLVDSQLESEAWYDPVTDRVYYVRHSGTPLTTGDPVPLFSIKPDGTDEQSLGAIGASFTHDDASDLIGFWGDQTYFYVGGRTVGAVRGAARVLRSNLASVDQLFSNINTQGAEHLMLHAGGEEIIVGRFGNPEIEIYPAAGGARVHSFDFVGGSAALLDMTVDRNTENIYYALGGVQQVDKDLANHVQITATSTQGITFDAERNKLLLYRSNVGLFEAEPDGSGLVTLYDAAADPWDLGDQPIHLRLMGAAQPV